MKVINDIPNAPKAIGPYSPAVISGNLVFLSGQIPLDPATGKLVEGGIEEQTRQVLKNISSILKHLKVDFSKVVKAVIFLSDLGNFKTVNEIYAQALGDSKPARSTIQVAGLPLGALVEIEMVVEID